MRQKPKSIGKKNLAKKKGNIQLLNIKAERQKLRGEGSYDPEFRLPPLPPLPRRHWHRSIMLVPCWWWQCPSRNRWEGVGIVLVKLCRPWLYRNQTTENEVTFFYFVITRHGSRARSKTPGLVNTAVRTDPVRYSKMVTRTICSSFITRKNSQKLGLRNEGRESFNR